MELLPAMMLRLACSLCAIACAAPLGGAGGTFVWGAISESDAGDDVAMPSSASELQQALRIDELEHQLEELRRSLDVCTANSHGVSGDDDRSNATAEALAQVRRSQALQRRPLVGGLVGTPVEDLVVAREFTSSNWGNGTLHQRANNINNNSYTAGRHRLRGRRLDNAAAAGADEFAEAAEEEAKAEADDEDKPIIGICLASTSKSKRGGNPG